jgi:site-specific DNA recombinase
MLVTGYIRVSTSQQDLHRQETLIKEYCTNNDHTLQRIISDSASGATSNRKGFQELLQVTDCDLIVVSELSRLTRQDDLLESLSFINIILKNNIGIVLLENGKTETLKGQVDLVQLITLVVKLSAAAEERKTIVQRMKTGRIDKFLSFPNMCYGKIPFGYNKVNNPDYVINKTPKSFLVRNEHAKDVEKIFKWVIEGVTMFEIANRLNLDESLISVVVHNPIYKGVWKLSGHIIKGDAIVTEDTWNNAQEALKSNRLRLIIRGVNFNPLKGILKCPCGHSLYIVKNPCKANPNNRQYRCAKNKNGKVCGNGGCNVDYTIEALWELVRCTQVNQSYLDANNAESQRITNELINIEFRINDYNEAINREEKQLEAIAVNMSRIDNKRLFDVMQSEYNKQEGKIKSFKKQVETLISRKNALKKVRKDLLHSLIFNKVATDEEKAEVFKRVFDNVVCYSINKMRVVLLATFKNGGQIPILIIRSGSYILPFKFNTDTRKFIIIGIDNEVDSYELEANYDLSDYKIKRATC